MASRRAGGAAAADLEALQQGVEALVKAAQPLGRAMDYLQEDVDGMTKEASFWSEEARKHGQVRFRETGRAWMG